MSKKFSVPNWGQSALAKAAGLDPKNVAVEHEDERVIAFVQFVPHCSVLVGKTDGTMTVQKEERYDH